ncbi:hypothetical protein INR49_011920 [Caranx melampygus]|nr:hypothetical protein INR49_011920 [Caranx melampygus]
MVPSYDSSVSPPTSRPCAPRAAPSWTTARRRGRSCWTHPSSRTCGRRSATTAQGWSSRTTGTG